MKARVWKPGILTGSQPLFQYLAGGGWGENKISVLPLSSATVRVVVHPGTVADEEGISPFPQSFDLPQYQVVSNGKKSILIPFQWESRLVECLSESKVDPELIERRRKYKKKHGGSRYLWGERTDGEEQFPGFFFFDEETRLFDGDSLEEKEETELNIGKKMDSTVIQFFVEPLFGAVNRVKAAFYPSDCFYREG